MITASLLLVLAVTTTDVDIATLPVSGDVRIALAPAGRCELRRDGTVSHVKIDIDRVMPPSAAGPVFNTLVVWAISPEGIFDNLGELGVNGTKGQFAGTTRLTQFGVLISAEPHYMVDRPSSSVLYRSQTPEDIRRRTAHVEVGAYDYAAIKPVTGTSIHTSVSQARAAFQIAQSVGAAQFAPEDFRNAQAAIGALEELVSRAAPLDILWPTAHEAIRWSQRAAMTARAKR